MSESNVVRAFESGFGEFVAALVDNTYAAASEEEHVRIFNYRFNSCLLHSNDMARDFCCSLIGVALDEVNGYSVLHNFNNIKLTPEDISAAVNSAIADANKLMLHIHHAEVNMRDHAGTALFLFCNLVKLIRHLRMIGNRYSY